LLYQPVRNRYQDPDLIWPFVGVACANFAAAVCIWVFFRKMDDEGVAAAAIGADRPIKGIVRPEDQKEGVQIKV
jgi:hypothetical protein